MTKHIAVGQAAPDFEFTDVRGRTIRLSDYRHEKNVVLVFTRGFI
jgi:peroxiredoxin